MAVHSSKLKATFDKAESQSSRRKNIYRDGFKRLFDVAFVVASLPMLLPIMACIALVVSLDGHNPLFRQERVGKDGRIFHLWKFRTMIPNAEARLKEFLAANPEAREEWNSRQKLSSDPRITKFGQFLRKTSLDELPQLLNVLNGTMSLIGPRPMMVAQQELYPGKEYYRLRPGLTGLWQVGYRNDGGFLARAQVDDTYGDMVSLLFDIKILVRTVVFVIRGTGYHVDYETIKNEGTRSNLAASSDVVSDDPYLGYQPNPELKEAISAKATDIDLELEVKLIAKRANDTSDEIDRTIRHAKETVASIKGKASH